MTQTQSVTVEEPARPILPEHVMPMGNRLLIDLGDGSIVNRAGIYVTGAKTEDQPNIRTAVVLAVGPGRRTSVFRVMPGEPFTECEPPPFEVGQTVIVDKLDCAPLPHVQGDGKYHLVDAARVMAVIDQGAA